MDFEPHIYFCADDFGLTEKSCGRIEEGVKNGCLNKISVLSNAPVSELKQKTDRLSDVRLCIHLNFVEGCCVGQKDGLSLLTDRDGNFKHSFAGLLRLSIFKRKEFVRQIKLEAAAQIEKMRSVLGFDAPIFLDGHQHTHMIPAVFSALCEAMAERGIKADYIRIPCEPITPFLKTPYLYFRYLSKNLIKQILLNFFGHINRRRFKTTGAETAVFFGIMFSGNMDHGTVKKLLPKYVDYAKKRGLDIEVLFHPGFVDADEKNEIPSNIRFKDFYLSKGRKSEYAAVMSLKNKKNRLQ